MKRKIIFFVTIAIIFIILPLTIFGAYVFYQSFGDDTSTAGTIEYDPESDFVMFYRPEDINNIGNNNTSLIEIPEGMQLLDGHEGFNIETNIVSSYASIKTNYDDVLDYIYLNQLGFSFRYKANINTMYRISVKSSWISHKVYLNGTVVDNIITKEKRVNEQFTSIPSDYYVDNETEYIYYKNIVNQSEEYNTLTLYIDNEYFYTVKPNSSYREYIIVEITFDIDIVQANRAKAKWELDKFPWI